VLWLRLGELSFLEKALPALPLLLLDDIFSELDHVHSKLIEVCIGTHQTIITSADPAVSSFFSDAPDTIQEIHL
jgi:recombinational DNA repair ATPase RecF